MEPPAGCWNGGAFTPEDATAPVAPAGAADVGAAAPATENANAPSPIGRMFVSLREAASAGAGIAGDGIWVGAALATQA